LPFEQKFRNDLFFGSIFFEPCLFSLLKQDFIARMILEKKNLDFASCAAMADLFSSESHREKIP